MSEPLSRAGFDAPPPSDRLFFAILPDAPAAARVERLVQALRDAHALKGKPIGADRLHVTLHHVGDFAGLPPQVLDAAGAAAAAVSATAPFALGFDRVASFSHKARNMPLVLLGGDGVRALSAFRQALVAALAGAGLVHAAQSPPSPYTPHLTLLYDDHHVEARAIEPISWIAREFVLVRSLIGRGRHERLARWPLRA